MTQIIELLLSIPELICNIVATPLGWLGITIDCTQFDLSNFLNLTQQ